MGIGLAGGTFEASERCSIWHGHERGHNLPFNCSHIPQRSLQEQCHGTWVGGKSRGGKRVPGFCWHVQGSHVGLPTRGPRDFNVSPPATHWWHAAGSPHGNKNCGSATSHGRHNNYPKGHPTTGHNRLRTVVYSLPTHSSKDADTLTRTKLWHLSSNLEAAASRAEEEEVASLDISKEEGPHQKWKERRPLVKLFKESHWEAFSKDSEDRKVAWQAYHPCHRGMFVQEGSYDLTPVFQEIAWETNLLNTEIYEVQGVWTGQQGLKAANHATKASQKRYTVFPQSNANQVIQNHGTEGDSPPKPYINEAATPTTPGAGRRARTKAWS